MKLEISLSVEMEERLRQEAQRCGLPREMVALRLLNHHLPPPLDARRASAVALLRDWMTEDANISNEELAANAEVLQQLDENRPSYRKLYGTLWEKEEK